MITLQPAREAINFLQGVELLAAGKWDPGFSLWEHRLEAFPELCKQDRQLPRWDGKSTDKRLVLWQEWGIGDTIHFSRYIPLVQELCPNVVLLVAPDLVKLFQYNFTLPVASEWTGVELQCSLLSLPERLKVYDVGRKPYFKAPFPAEAYAGLTGFVPFGANPEAPQALRKDEEERLRAGRPWVSLKPEATGARDWLDTACILANLESLVSIDTGVAHLAGALGVPTELWLRKDHDWRWYAPPYESVTVRILDA